MSDGFAQIMEQMSPEIAELSRATKALIQKVMPDVVEVAWVRQKNIGYGVGPKKMSEQFCYIKPATKHVNLGFYYGADLPDPTGLLEGTGKLMRHVKISDLAQLEDPALLALVEAASQYLPKLA